MIPIRDFLPTRRPAYVNLSLILANVFFYFFFFGFTFSPNEAQFASVLFHRGAKRGRLDAVGGRRRCLSGWRILRGRRILHRLRRRPGENHRRGDCYRPGRAAVADHLAQGTTIRTRPRVSREPTQLWQPPVSDAGADHADGRRSSHAALVRAK